MGTVLGAWFGAVPIPLDWYVENLSFFIFFLSPLQREARVLLGNPGLSPAPSGKLVGGARQ